MEDHIYQIRKYLPIKFVDEEANNFLKYLEEAYLENVNNKKYQFAFKAFHMLYMTFIYKAIWFLKQRGHNIKNILEESKKKLKERYKTDILLNTLFDLSRFKEKESLEDLLKALAFHDNEVKDCKDFVDKRDHCSHATGRIQYSKDEIDFYIVQELKYIDKLCTKKKGVFKKFLANFLEKKWNKNFIGGDIKNWFLENYLSVKDLEMLAKFELPLFNKQSDSEKNIYQKLLYLVFVYEAQKQTEIDKNIFLDKLPMFMYGLEDEVKVTKDGDEKTISTQEIIEENLIPIISDLSDEEREKAERILNLS